MVRPCREWVYYDCVLELGALRLRYHFPEFIINHINNDAKSGTKAGFVCEVCNDAVMGLHPSAPQDKVRVC